MVPRPREIFVTLHGEPYLLWRPFDQHGAVALDQDLQQRDLLLQLGCEYGQGYFYGRPQPAPHTDEIAPSVEIESR